MKSRIFPTTPLQQQPSKISTMRPTHQNRAQKRPNPTTTPTRTLNCSKTSQLLPRPKKKQSFVSDLVMLAKGKNESINNKNDHEGKEGNGKNIICNCRIEYATTATIENNRYTTKCTLDIRPEKQNHVIISSKVHQNMFEAIKQMDETAVIIKHDSIRIINSNTPPTTRNTALHSPIEDYTR